MKKTSMTDHPYFLLLLTWRGILAALALHAVLEKPFEAMLLALLVIAGFALVGEFVYARKVRWDEEQRRLQAEREMRERRAEEARLRYEAARAAKEAARAAGGGGFGLDADEAPVPAPKAGTSAIAALSPADFDDVLRDAELAQRRA